ncbi:ferredoxin [Nocardia jinanensis]|uniref:Ferredoxin n=1 Tax=Nocardia jinanensis TaxID=382504 RepID=A0A917RPP6_9NOCA|nr:ferredoxin [Nocardia jinanensis]GGL17989.1 ferredoxin [Nocardia jinanensis]
MKIKLDRTLCDGFGICAKHAPEHFPLDDWGYASLAGGPAIASTDEGAVTRALLDCPVHAITVLPDSNRMNGEPAATADEARPQSL